MLETHDLWADVLRAGGGAKRVRHALGVKNLSYVYKMGRAPEDGGTRNLFDRFEAVVELLATRPGARPALRKIQLWCDALFRRVLDGFDPEPVSLSLVRGKALGALREITDVLEACGQDPAEVDPAAIIEQSIRARDWMDRLIAAAEVGIDGEGPSLRRLP